MEFIVERDLLLPTLSATIGAVGKSTLPILSNFHVAATSDKVEFAASDLEIEMRASCAAQIIEDGKITVPARKLLEIARTLPSGAAIKVKLTDGRCQLTSGRSRFSLSVLPSEEFPTLETVEGFTFNLDAAQLKALLEKTAFAMAKDDVRYYLNGMLFDLTTPTLTVVATNGHRMARLQTDITIKTDEPRQLVLPHKTVMEMKRLLSARDRSVEFKCSERAMQITFDNDASLSLRCKLIDGRYPEYERVIPKDLESTATVNRDEMKKALSRIALVSGDKHSGVHLSFSDSVLRLHAAGENNDVAEEDVTCNCTAEMRIGFNIKYVSDVLNTVTDDDVQIQFTDSNSSSLWRGETSPLETFIVMPMRI